MQTTCWNCSHYWPLYSCVWGWLTRVTLAWADLALILPVKEVKNAFADSGTKMACLTTAISRLFCHSGPFYKEIPFVVASSILFSEEIGRLFFFFWIRNKRFNPFSNPFFYKHCIQCLCDFASHFQGILQIVNSCMGFIKPYFHWLCARNSSSSITLQYWAGHQTT